VNFDEKVEIILVINEHFDSDFNKILAKKKPMLSIGLRTTDSLYHLSC